MRESPWSLHYLIAGRTSMPFKGQVDRACREVALRAGAVGRKIVLDIVVPVTALQGPVISAICLVQEASCGSSIPAGLLPVLAVDRGV